MNGSEFVDRVRQENDTALSRLGSSKALYADTGGEMEPETVLRAAADAEHHAAETYAEWADSTDDTELAAAFTETADEERDHYDTVVGELDDHEPGDVPAIQAYLREIEDAVGRLGAFVGRTIAADASKSQLTGYFTGQAEPGMASLFREIDGDLDDQLDRATALLEEHCADADDWERALTAADEAIQTAYDEYTERLESMGVNPKPVC